MENVSVRPLGEWMTVKRVDSDSEVGGIFIPEEFRGKSTQGVVMAVGTGRVNTETGERIPLDVQVGDRVVFGKFAGAEIEVDGELLMFVREVELLAVLG